MVDLQVVISGILLLIVGVPTLALALGRIMAFFMSYIITEAVTLKPEGERKGKALIIFEPGATLLTKNVAGGIGRELSKRGFEVKVAGIRSAEAKDTSGYDLLLLGTPTYMGRPTGRFRKFVRKLDLAKGQIFGIYLTGTRGASEMGLVPRVFLDIMKKPLAERSTEVKQMAFIGFKPYDYSEFVSSLLS